MNSKDVAKKLMSQKNDLEQAREKIAALEEELAPLRKRAAAERILIRSKDAKEAPSRLRPASVDDFLSKRAMLEESSPDELEKTAGLVDLYDGQGDGLGIELFDDSPADGAGDFNDFLRQHI